MILWLGKRDYWETILLPNSPKKYNPPQKNKTLNKKMWSITKRNLWIMEVVLKVKTFSQFPLQYKKKNREFVIN